MKYISSNQFIGRFIQSLGLENTEYVHQFPQWIEDAIDIMCVPKYYTTRTKILEINNHSSPLPCDESNIFAFFVKNNKTAYRLTMRNNPMIGNLVSFIPCYDAFGTIDGDCLKTTFKKGEVIIVYKGIPIDSKGFPLVPDNAKFFEALQYYFIKNLTLQGFTHPVFDFDKAYMLWEKHYPRAANSLNWFTNQEYQEFTELWVNNIIGDLQELNYLH